MYTKNTQMTILAIITGILGGVLIYAVAEKESQTFKVYTVVDISEDKRSFKVNGKEFRVIEEDTLLLHERMIVLKYVDSNIKGNPDYLDNIIGPNVPRKVIDWIDVAIMFNDELIGIPITVH